MLQFKQDDEGAVMILTLTELVTIPAPFYLFEFIHVLTKVEVSFTKSEADDESDYPERFNQFTINASEVFEDQPVGEWHYNVYELEDDSIIDFDNLKLLETGKLILDRSTEFEFTQYNESTSFKTYNG
jgi:subtilisin-like proprotein convertase family protein